MHENQNTWRLLLLRLWPSRLKTTACFKLCKYGTRHDRSNQVSSKLFLMFLIHGQYLEYFFSILYECVYFDTCGILGRIYIRNLIHKSNIPTLICICNKSSLSGDHMESERKTNFLN